MCVGHSIHFIFLAVCKDLGSLTVPISSAETTLNKVSQIEMQFGNNKVRVSFSKTEHSFPSVHFGWFCMAFPDPGTEAQPFKKMLS